MKFIGFSVAFGLVFVFLVSPAFSSYEITPDDVLSIAEREKEVYFGMIALNYAIKYRSHEYSNKTFQTFEEVVKYSAEKQNHNAMKLTTPFRVYTMSIDAIINYREGTDISGILTPTKLWLIPLEINGKARACMEVGFMDGKWQAVGISMGEFGENLKKIPAEFAPEKSGNRFVRIYPASTDFIAVESKGETKVMMPSYAEKTPDKKPKDSQGLFRASDIMSELAEKIRSMQY